MKLFKEILFPLIAVIAAFIVGGIVILIIGDSPIQTYKLLLGSAFSWPNSVTTASGSSTSIAAESFVTSRD